jgi:hypothetical protein
MKRPCTLSQPVWKWIAAIVLTCQLSQATAAESGLVQDRVQISQINLRWFGNDRLNLDALGQERRTASIRQHLEDNDLLGEVMVFEEIVDLPLLSRGVLRDKYRCQSYHRAVADHQYVVVCVIKALRFDHAPGEKSYALEDVDVTGRLRPAVHGLVKTDDGKPITHLVAVHLKADPAHSRTRLRQMTIIRDYLRRHQRSGVPVTIVGDFNTFNDDSQAFSRLLAELDISEVESPEEFTWASSEEKYPPAKFDRTWMSAPLQSRVVGQNVVGPCNDATETELRQYNLKVSDHCAVKTVILIN